MLTQQKLTFHAWRKGQPSLRLIRAEEGFCFLTGVTGSFQGGGETLFVRIEQDGDWHFGGHAGSYIVAGQCAVYRFDSFPAK